MTPTTWYWIGLAGQLVGCVAFGPAAARAQERRWQTVYTLYFFICLIAAALYLAQATSGTTGAGAYVSADGTTTVWLPYLTWFTSTPLLLLALLYLGRTSLPLAGAMLGANAFMIATGFVATVLPEDDRLTLVWYVISCGAYAAIAWAFLGRYRREAVGALPRSKAVFDKIVAVHLVLWTAYPVVWILSPEGLDVFGDTTEAMLFTLLDVAAKTGFGFLAVSSLRQIEANGDGGAFPSNPHPARVMRGREA